ncbi:Protein tyrosine phosphatase [Methylocella tundrae]|uniref:Protein tyrosine phosphatase n=1 Tax=Methylocella tundrae TaxID=227605 RepID=A0A8B6M915_METTU|nr:protein-tyrosine phosphatase family protein [Methylocella tundrae]VTZ27268.1 Protein tyrosine phosphatase [Methylocella tundrae]VTZ50961.1 Protein tyrosine phosphatase [Methylocella tundrae]
MGRLHVCSLAKVPQTVRETGARSLVTLLDQGTPVARPLEIAADRHLHVSISDIVKAIDGHVLPTDAHVAELLDFVRRWDLSEPMLIHCYAGVSRSTAAAFIAACALNPERNEVEIALAIRRVSPTATPNARLVTIADAMLRRRGRMTAAIEQIGRGEECFEGVPFALELH